MFRLYLERELAMDLSNESTFTLTADMSAFAYGFALFTDLLVAALSAAHLMLLLLDARRKRRAMCIFGEVVAGPPPPLFSLPNIFRGIVIGFLLTILLRTIPDVLWMLGANGTTNGVRWLIAAETICDTLALFPFIISLGLVVWSGQVIPQKLMEAASIKLARPQLEDARPFLWPSVIVLMIAVGVTVGKAHG